MKNIKSFLFFLRNNMSLGLIFFLGYCLLISIEKQISGLGILAIVLGIIFFSIYFDILSNVANGSSRWIILKQLLSTGFSFLKENQNIFASLISIFSTLSNILSKYKKDLSSSQRENITKISSDLSNNMKYEPEKSPPDNAQGSLSRPENKERYK